MNIFLQRLMMRARLMAPADDGMSGGSGGSAADRGDDFTPTAEDEDEAASAAAAAAAAKNGKTEQELADDLKGKGKEGLGAGKEGAGADDDGEDDGKGGKKKDTRIPLSRHEAVLARERAAREAAEVELAKVRQGAATKAVNTEISKLEAQVVEKEEKYAELLAEGKTKEATALMREIRGLERDIITQQAEARTAAATADAVETVRFDAVVERLEAAYPQLKPDAPEYDKELVAEVLDMQSAYVAKGYTPSAALQKAVGYIIRPETGKQKDATSVTPRVTEAEAAAAAKDARAAEQRKKNAGAADAQPPALANAGANSDAAGGVLDAKTVIKMPFDKFSKLSEEEISRLRGDTV